MTAATRERPAVRRQEVNLPMLDQFTTSPTFGDPRLPARFWAKVNEHGPIPAHRPDLGPCWIWTAGHASNGYGRFQAGSRSDGTRKMIYAHRWAYQHLVGPFPHGLQSDHLCRNHACVNPAHIEPVTSRENILRGNGVTAALARQTHCLRGHRYDEANTYRYHRGWRKCRVCDAFHQRAYRQRKAADRARRSRS